MQLSTGNDGTQVLSPNPFEILGNTDEEIEMVPEKLVRTLETDRRRIPTQIPRLNVPNRLTVDSNKGNQRSEKNDRNQELETIPSVSQTVATVIEPNSQKEGAPTTGGAGPSRGGPVATTGTTPACPATCFLSAQEKRNKNNVGVSQLEKEIALVNSRLLPNHPLNMATSSKVVDIDKRGTHEEDRGSTEIDEKEEIREFNYYMMRQDRNSLRGNKNKGGIRVRGQSSRNPSGI